MMQGSLLAARGITGAEAFPFMARRVSSGDKDNLEAQAARRYWPLLMGRTSGVIAMRPASTRY